MNNKNNRETTILVTGSTGTVGSEVVKQLASISSSSGNNISIRAAVHSQNKADPLKQFNNKGVEIVDLDYTKPETIAGALNKVDKLFLQTLPVPDITDITSNLVKVAKKNDVKHVVKLSAMGADSEPGSTILRLHGKEEKIIEESGIPYTFLRPPAFMQNFITQFGHTIRTQNAFYVPAGDAKMSFVDTRDIAAIASKILTNKNGGSQQHVNKTYDITGSDTLSYSQVAEILSSEVGKKISYVDVTEEDARKGMK
ncbi:MAG: SDR family oxidoreductase [Nitrososphaeraceae archaeon]